MTDKPIIIDGVDVSGCSYHYKHTRVCLVKMDAAGRYYNCANWHDCDFKKLSQQLKCKEQECERLKEEVSLLKESNLKLPPMEDVSSLEKYYLQQLDQLKAKNKELEEVNDEKNELLAQLGCPTIATARRLALTLKEQVKAKEEECDRLKETFKFVLDETIKEHRLYESKLERIIYEQLG